MRFHSKAAVVLTVLALGGGDPVRAQNMVKMCLFYPSASGHARSDPIINQKCASDHIHTFYGPQNFHPNTTYEDLLATPPGSSSTPFIENESLYWHPTIFQVVGSGANRTYVRPTTDSSPYYRWDNSVEPKTEAFPPGFRMIAYSNQRGGQQGGETGSNMIVECCQLDAQGDEDCTETGFFALPTQTCDFVGIAMAMPTCWDGKSLGDDNDHVSHMAYTLDGSVAGQCPQGFPRRLPQVQLFVRVGPYRGGTYVLADGSTNVWHVDFMNGWEEGKLQDIIDNCPVLETAPGDYNPPCNCDQFLTPNTRASGALCESDVRSLILDEATDGMSVLPRGTCKGGAGLIPKSWTVTPPLNCTPVVDDPSDGDDEDEGDGEGDEDEDEGDGEGDEDEGEGDGQDSVEGEDEDPEEGEGEDSQEGEGEDPEEGEGEDSQEGDGEDSQEEGEEEDSQEEGEGEDSREEGEGEDSREEGEGEDSQEEGEEADSQEEGEAEDSQEDEGEDSEEEFEEGEDWEEEDEEEGSSEPEEGEDEDCEEGEDCEEEEDEEEAWGEWDEEDPFVVHVEAAKSKEEPARGKEPLLVESGAVSSQNVGFMIPELLLAGAVAFFYLN